MCYIPGLMYLDNIVIYVIIYQLEKYGSIYIINLSLIFIYAILQNWKYFFINIVDGNLY